MLFLRSESKGINPAVGTHVETISGGDQGLEMTKALHGGTRTRREQRLAGIALESMQPVVAFGADHPNNRCQSAPIDPPYCLRRSCLHIGCCAGTIKEGMTRLEGRPLSAAIAKIGLPIEERTIAGKKVYIWGSLEMPTKAPKEKNAKFEQQ
jgi:hypothetical protein